MDKFPMEWLLNVRKNELSSIEAELADVNNRLNSNVEIQNEKESSLNKFIESLYTCTETSKVPSLVRSIEQFELAIAKLKEEMAYLQKEREMVFNRYNQKSIEIKLLEKVKSSFLTKAKKDRLKKEEQKINELSLLVRKDN